MCDERLVGSISCPALLDAWDKKCGEVQDWTPVDEASPMPHFEFPATTRCDVSPLAVTHECGALRDGCASELVSNVSDVVPQWPATPLRREGSRSWSRGSDDGSEASFAYYFSGNYVASPTRTMQAEDVVVHHNRVLGTGEFGVVCMGQYDGHDVAVKIMRSAPGHNAQRGVELFTQELACLTSLDHPNVVRCYGGSSVLPNVYIVEELMQGSLSELLYQRTPGGLSMRRILAIGLDIARGLSYIHECPNAVLHGDLRPDNILLDADGAAKLSDFGLAQCIGTSGSQTGYRGGTLAYMAPECLDVSLGHVTEKSDVFSFGVLMWEMCNRQQPWQGYEACHFVQRMVYDGARPSLSQCDAQCPMALRNLIAQCWDADVDTRPSSADVVAVLERMLRFTSA